MGVSISIKQRGKWKDITPGWRSQMANWLMGVGGERMPICFTERDIPALNQLKRKQRKGEVEPPFDQSKEWTDCFNTIIRAIRRNGEAIVNCEW